MSDKPSFIIWVNKLIMTIEHANVSMRRCAKNVLTFIESLCFHPMDAFGTIVFTGGVVMALGSFFTQVFFFF